MIFKAGLLGARVAEACVVNTTGVFPQIQPADNTQGCRLVRVTRIFCTSWLVGNWWWWWSFRLHSTVCTLLCSFYCLVRQYHTFFSLVERIPADGEEGMHGHTRAYMSTILVWQTHFLLLDHNRFVRLGPPVIVVQRNPLWIRGPDQV